MLRPLAPLLIMLSFMAVTAQTVVRVGAGTAIPGLFDPIKAPLEKERNIKLVYKEEAGVDQLLDIEAGNLDVVVSGITMEGWLETMKARGKAVRPAYDYKHMQIGVDQLSVLVNPDVVSDVEALGMDLDKKQIKGLFTGKYKNWKELGGPDLPVTVIVSRLSVATTKVFRDVALDGEPLVGSFRTINGGMYDLAKALIDIKGAITFGPVSLTANAKIWSPGQAPKIERPFTLVVSDKLEPATSKAVASLVDYILGPGQKYITK